MPMITSFTFNPFQENTYVVYDDTKECIIIDPGCYSPSEKEELARHIDESGLRPVRLINTHCHIDHMLGNKFVKERFDIPFLIHKQEEPLLKAAPEYGQIYQIYAETSPLPDEYLKEGDKITFGNSELEVLFTPGHSPGHISLYSAKGNFILSGDVLFLNSIGRTDLPGGDHQTLLKSIKEKLLPLNDTVKVYSGHGPATTIGYERRNNPFL